MPKVGGKKFKYNAAGKAAAAAEAKKTGKPVVHAKSGGLRKTRGTGAATKGLMFHPMPGIKK